MVPEEYKPWPLARMLHTDPRIPAHLRDPASWPEPMRAEWGHDEGITSFALHRERCSHRVRPSRERSPFRPDFILDVGRRQYENFREDVIPPFCVLAYDTLYAFNRSARRPNMGEPSENAWRWQLKGGRFILIQPAGARHGEARGINGHGDIVGNYEDVDGVAHAFANTLLYLDLDRQGFSYPVLPVTVNCYGRDVIRYQGGGTQHAEEADPPAPSPRRCFELGRLTARILRESPWRVVLMASSSWSHAFLTAKTHFLYPDLEADRVLLGHLRAGDYDTWRDLPLERLEASGQHEVLNWVCLAGAMAELNRKPTWTEYLETYIFNSNKCFAIFKS
jgi:hypothetical protein